VLIVELGLFASVKLRKVRLRERERERETARANERERDREDGRWKTEMRVSERPLRVRQAPQGPFPRGESVVSYERGTPVPDNLRRRFASVKLGTVPSSSSLLLSSLEFSDTHVYEP